MQLTPPISAQAPHCSRSVYDGEVERRSASEGTNKAKTAATHPSVDALVTLSTPDSASSAAPWAALVDEVEFAASPRTLRGVDRLAGAPAVFVNDRLETFAAAVLWVVRAVTACT